MPRSPEGNWISTSTDVSPCLNFWTRMLAGQDPVDMEEVAATEVVVDMEEMVDTVEEEEVTTDPEAAVVSKNNREIQMPRYSLEIFLIINLSKTLNRCLEDKASIRLESDCFLTIRAGLRALLSLTSILQMKLREHAQ